MVVDKYSRFAFAYRCPNDYVDSNSVFRPVVCSLRHAEFCSLRSGLSFMSRELKSNLTKRGVSTNRSRPYHSTGNSQVERCNRTIWKSIQLALKGRRLPVTHLETVLNDALHSTRSLPCTANRMSVSLNLLVARQTERRFLCGWLHQGSVLLRKYNHST